MLDVIFYQDRATPWFELSRKSLLASTPLARIHIIANPDEYNDVCGPFDRGYIHRSTNPKYFEMACFRRWLVINEYRKRHGIERFLVMDWDILVFCDLVVELARYDGMDFTYQNETSVGFSVWNNGAAMQSYVDMIMECYTVPDSTIARTIVGIYDDMTLKGMNGGICDMTIAHQLIHCGKYRSCDTYVVENGMCFDNNMTITDGWDTDRTNMIKSIRFKDGQAFCKYGGQEVRMMVLHFAGHARELMEEHYKRCYE